MAMAIITVLSLDQRTEDKANCTFNEETTMTDAVGYDGMLHADAGQVAQSKASVTGAHRDDMDFSSALSAWRDIALPTMQNNLESTCPALIDAQREALLSRKKLAEQTREFKKLATEVQPEHIKPLLKAYQTEIDSLTKRAKTAENAVLGVHDRLQGACDPYPLLELLVEQTAAVADAEALRSQLQTLRAKQTTLEQQLAALPALEADKKRLTDRLATLEESSQRRLAEARKTIESELSAKWDERIRNHTAREESLTKSLESTQSQLQQLRTSYAKATERLLSHGEEVERGETSGKIEELEVISEELARSNERVLATERRNEQLRQEIERLKSNAGEDERIQELERRMSEALGESQKLAHLLDAEVEKGKRDKEQDVQLVAERDSQLREKVEENNTLRARINRMSDYEEIKRELEIFKYVEFAVDADRRFGDAAQDGAESNGVDESTSSAAKPLEALLIEKNKAMQEELTNLRVRHQELVASSDAANSELNDARRELERVHNLNARLEDDLVNMKPEKENASKSTSSMSAEEALAEMGKMTGAKSTATPNGSTNATKSSNVPTPIAQARATPVASGTATPIQGSSSSSSSILPIITSQRDRFRARNAELEEELRKQFSTITELRTEVKTLQADNLGLYEKVRYLQAYNSGAQAGGTSNAASPAYRGQMGGSRIINMATARSDASYPPSTALRAEDKYREKYEASMNPFEQFRGSEHSRALHALNPLERLLHMATRIVLGHRRMRIFFVVYAVSLHLLVFAMLFEVEFGSNASAIVSAGQTPA